MIRLNDLDELAVDHNRFMFKLTDLREAGERVPCVGDGRWISEDRAEQTAAARECRECPALTDCRRYLDRWHEPVGVWAGLTERDRDGRRANGGKTARRAS